MVPKCSVFAQKLLSGQTCAYASILWHAFVQREHLWGKKASCSQPDGLFQKSEISPLFFFFFVGRAWFILAASAPARRCEQRTERNGGFGFQTKVKDRSLNQRRWTCWYSCRKKHASPVSNSQFSFTFLFVLVLKSLLSLLFTSRYAMEAFLNFLLLLLLLFDSSVFAKHSVIY